MENKTDVECLGPDGQRCPDCRGEMIDGVIRYYPCEEHGNLGAYAGEITVRTDDVLTGADLIARERRRQIEKEGWTAKHDEDHLPGTLCAAGASYALDVTARLNTLPEGQGYWVKACADASDSCWPWSEDWWKATPKDGIRQLVKAGALIAAEIDKFQSK